MLLRAKRKQAKIGMTTDKAKLDLNSDNLLPHFMLKQHQITTFTLRQVSPILKSLTKALQSKHDTPNFLLPRPSYPSHFCPF